MCLYGEIPNEVDKHNSHDGIECSDVGITGHAVNSPKNHCFGGGSGESAGSVDMSSYGNTEETSYVYTCSGI
jgi:hypothetical protein